MSNYDQLLQFVAGNDKGNKSLSKIDNDVISWMLLSSDIIQNGDPLHNDQFSKMPTSSVPLSDASAATNPMSNSCNTENASTQEKMLPNFSVGRSRYSSIASSTVMPKGSEASVYSSETMSTTDLKKQQRLEKNREIARNCRKRKREKFEMMESEAKRLREENTELKFLLLRGRDSQRRETDRLEQFEYMKKNQNTLSEKDLSKYLKQYYDSWQDYGEGRRRSIAFHLEQLKGLLLPSQLTKLIIWSFSTDIQKKHISSSSSSSSDGVPEPQGPSVQGKTEAAPPPGAPANEMKPEQVIADTILKDTNIEDASRQLDIMNALESFDIQSRDGFWNLICKVMNMTEEQQKAILSVNPLIRKQRNNVKCTINLLSELQDTINQNLEGLQNMVTQYMNILDPHQQIKLLEWIEANQACMYMLNTFWNNNTK